MGDEASLDFAQNLEDTGAEFASQSTPMTPANHQKHVQTSHPSLRQIAPKPQVDDNQLGTRTSSS